MKNTLGKIEVHVGINCAKDNSRLTASLNGKRISLAEARRLVKSHKLNRTESNGYSYLFWDVYSKGKECSSETKYWLTGVQK